MPRNARATIARKVWRNRGGDRIVFPVGVDLGERHPVLFYFREHVDARRLAERVARALELPVHDSAGGATVVRELDLLDAPLADAPLEADGPAAPASRAASPPPLPRLPAGSALVPYVSDGELGIDLPGPRPGGSIAVLVIMLSGPVAVTAFLAATSFGAAAAWAFGGMALVPVLIAVLERVLPNTEHLALLPDFLRLTRRRSGSTKSRELPLEELEEVGQIDIPTQRAAGRHPVVFARGDTGSLEFGGGVSASERGWIEEVIRRYASRG